MRLKNGGLMLALLCGMGGLGVANAQTQGVTKDQILLGYPNDLSGPVAEVGRAVQNGVRMAEEEINAAGGVHGRKLKILVEDNGYDPKKACWQPRS